MRRMPLEGPRRQRGFTLIELLVTITVLVILSSIAATSYSTSVNNNRLYASQNEFVAYLALARSEAARAYSASRGIHDREVIERMGIGYAPGQASRRGLYWVQLLAAPRV